MISVLGPGQGIDEPSPHMDVCGCMPHPSTLITNEPGAGNTPSPQRPYIYSSRKRTRYSGTNRLAFVVSDKHTSHPSADVRVYLKPTRKALQYVEGQRTTYNLTLSSPSHEVRNCSTNGNVRVSILWPVLACSGARMSTRHGPVYTLHYNETAIIPIIHHPA